MEVRRIRPSSLQRLLEDLRELKRDLQVQMLIEEYPVLKKLEENPSPADWATFSSYIRMIHVTQKPIHPEIRRKLLDYQKVFVEKMNQRLASVGGYWVTVEDGDTILNYYDETGELKKVKLGYVDVMNILGAKNTDKVVEIIIRRSEGTFED